MELSKAIIVMSDEDGIARNAKLSAVRPTVTTNTGNNKGDGISSNTSGSAAASLRDSARACRRATARMYAAEACCCLGDAVQALTFLAGDEQEYAVDCLASDLGGVTVERASVSSYGKRRLA